jgi:DNA-binding NtrC family response regulator
MAKKKNSKDILIPYLALEGARAAAVALRRFPGAVILPSSSYSLDRTLELALAEDCSSVHILGLGVNGPVDGVLEKLAALKERKIEVHWYAAGDYLAALRPRLEPLCHCVFAGPREDRSLAAYLEDVFFPKNEGGESSLVVNETGSKYAAETNTDGTRDVKDQLIHASMWRYFNFRDLEAYPHAIRVVAGQEPLGEAEERIIDSYNRTGDNVLIGKSKVMDHLKDQIQACGSCDSRVLILGETGAGKEIVAQLLHESGSRAGKPFVAVNCATLDGDLQLDMLFGHEKGAFTGAVDSRAGCFENAHEGTLFMDEVGELTAPTQAQLLRVIQDGVFRRLGGKDDLEVDVRIVAATNRNLLEEVDKGRFRADLYYRLAVLRIEVPPLRKRLEDLPLLVRAYLYKHKDRARRGVSAPKDLKPGDYEELKRHSWPGNVRELHNVLERFIIMKPKSIRECIDRPVHDAADDAPTGLTLREMELRYVQSTLDKVGSIAEASKALGITRNTLKAKIRAGAK